jgi:tetratricopeptide (TPR) repeat protein
MTQVNIPLKLKEFPKNSKDLAILREAETCRRTVRDLIAESRLIDAYERAVGIMRSMREFSDYENTEFRSVLVALLFDITELHFALKDYRQSEKELEILFRVLESLLKVDPERFGPYHILAMELSTRILRSRKKAIDMLASQKAVTAQLYEKVNSGMVAATDRLVDSMRKTAQLLASSGDYRGALKFLAEAIRFSKKRTGKVSRKEVKMTIEMAEIMLRVRSMHPRAHRLLTAVLPHAINLETIELEEDILAMLEVINNAKEHEPRWRTFIHKLTSRKPKDKEAGNDK